MIKPYAGQKVAVSYPMNDAEASQYAGEFVQVFRDAGWDCGPLRGSFFAADFKNAVATASKKLEAKGGPVAPPKGLLPLVQALMTLGLSDNRGLDPLQQINLSDSIEVHEIELRIGYKPPPDDAVEQSP